MSAQALEVVLDGVPMGRVERGTRGELSFTYSPGYRERDSPTPLSCSMPVTGTRYRDRVVAPFLWGLLPDNPRVLQRWARDFQVSPSNALALLANVGADLPGAIQIIDPESTPDDDDDVAWLDEADVAALLRRVRLDQTAWLAPGSDGRWSLAGAQAKIALLERDGRWGRPSGRSATNRILKPAIDGLDDHDVNEHLCMAAAQRLGMRTAPTRVAHFEDERAIVVTRYDRTIDASGTLRRVHQEDLCQALGVHPDHKYESDGGPSAAQIVALLRAHAGGTASGNAVDRFVDALIYNWLIAAPDAHAKNFSLLLSGPAVRLAPLYDMASALQYGDVYEPKVKLAMKIGGYYKLAAIGRSAWEKQARALGLDAEALVSRAIDLARRLPDAFSDAISAAGADAVTATGSLLLDKLAARAKSCEAVLAA